MSSFLRRIGVGTILEIVVLVGLGAAIIVMATKSWSVNVELGVSLAGATAFAIGLKIWLALRRGSNEQ
jgi:hypothetical protein